MRSNVRSRRRRHGFPIIIILVVFAITASGVFICVNFLNSTLADSIDSKAQAGKIKSSKLYSESIILVDAQTGEALYSKNENEKCYPASLTKIMTAITAIHNRESLDSTVTIDGVILDKLRNENASMAGYVRGDRTSVEDLLYGCLLASGADASLGLAKATAGLESSFADLMNNEADELELSNTHFTNTTGLQNDDHYTTAKEMSKILRYALENPTFKEIFTSKSHCIQTDSREFTVQSTFFSEYLGENIGYTVEGAKTGTTSAAGHCLASLVKKDGREYILVTLNAPMGGSSQPFSFDDLDYIFKNI